MRRCFPHPRAWPSSHHHIMFTLSLKPLSHTSPQLNVITRPLPTPAHTPRPHAMPQKTATKKKKRPTTTTEDRPVEKKPKTEDPAPLTQPDTTPAPREYVLFSHPSPRAFVLPPFVPPHNDESEDIVTQLDWEQWALNGDDPKSHIKLPAYCLPCQASLESWHSFGRHHTGKEHRRAARHELTK